MMEEYICKETFDEFKNAIKDESTEMLFVEEYINSHFMDLSDHHNLINNTYAHMLNTAIIFDEHSTIAHIFNKDLGTFNILTVEDNLGSNPLSSTLYSGCEECLKLVDDYIKKIKGNITLTKVVPDSEIVESLITIMRCPQFEYLPVYEECSPSNVYNRYLKNLYTGDSLKDLAGYFDIL